MRQNMQSMVDRWASGILEHLSDPENLRALAKDHFRPGSPIFDKALAEQRLTHQKVQALHALDEPIVEQVFKPS